ncbi:MAG: hypothetical protein SNH27_17110, partial [Rikenellaceae bacterium]
VHIDSSPFTYHNKNIDSVMRTLRDALGPNTQHYWDGKHNDIIFQLVNYYNYSYHRAIKMTPHQMHNDVELEWKYIRKMTEKLNDIKRQQIYHGLHSYKPGCRLMIHLDFSKTYDKHTKRRRTFNATGTFIQYINGNCEIHLDKPFRITKNRSESTVQVPIFYTARIPLNVDTIDDTWHTNNLI